MDALFNLIQSLVNVFWSLLDVVLALVHVILPWLPLIAWLAYWTFAVNWSKALPIIWRGGWIGIVLLMFIAMMVWGAVDPPVENHLIFGLKVGNYTGKFVYVTLLTCMALLCGAAQLSGYFGKLCDFPDPPEESHNDHSHDDHAHAAH